MHRVASKTIKREPRQARYVPAVAVSVIEKSVGSVDDESFGVEGRTLGLDADGVLSCWDCL